MSISSEEKLTLFAKMLTCMDEIVENAEEIERHAPGKKTEDKDLKEMRVFVSAFKDEDSVVPVKLLVKEYYVKGNGLYVTIALDKIKETALHDQSLEENRSLTISDINLSELLREVNRSGHKSLAKYIPQQFVDKSQESVKELDSDYMAAVERGDMEEAQQMVDQAAKKAGYNYRG